jgi:hypothetical protein
MTAASPRAWRAAWQRSSAWPWARRSAASAAGGPREAAGPRGRRGGEQLFYGVELQSGQSVKATATVAGRSTTSYFMDLKLYSPQRQEIGDASEPFGEQDRRVELRAESEPAQQPGIHFISLAARKGGADVAEQFDTRIEFQVTGAAATPTPSAQATASAAPKSGREDSSGFPIGAVVLGLAVGVVVGFGGRRALSRG